MNSTATLSDLSVEIRAADRLAMTLVYALLMHGVLILGLNFDLGRARPEPYEPGMEITLVNPGQQEENPAADFLANANQQGGGNQEAKTLPTARLAGRPDAQSEVAAVTAQPIPVSPSRQDAVSPMTIDKRRPEKISEPKPAVAAPPRKRISGAMLMAQAREYARLEAQLAAQANEYAKMPRKKYLNASTREYKYSAYLEHWRTRVERIGNLNYPQAASQRGITGSLRLSVEVNADGSVRDILLRKSSGYEVLDQAAMHIVRLAAPFADFPEHIRKDTDVLVITRTWQFLPGNRLSSH